MIIFLVNALKVIFLLGFLVLIHESGHFLVARLCKVKVNEFAIGFGPTIWKKQGKKTLYALRAIPLGGFVNMEGEQERSKEKGSFSEASILKRIAIVLAGGTVNIIFGILLYFVLVSSTGNYISTTIDSIENDKLEYLQAGDEIERVNGKTIRLKSDLDTAIQLNNGEKVDIEIKRDGEVIKIKEILQVKDVKTIGIYFNDAENFDGKIDYVYPNSVAQNAKIEAGDKIISINGEKIDNNPYTIINKINETEGKLKLEIDRKGKIEEVELTPDVTKTYSLGVLLKMAENNFINNIYYGFWDTTDFSISIIENLKQLFSGKVTTDQLMGPIGISETVAETKGVGEYVYIIALISLSLGVTNLLPFPPLDGGKIVLLIIEGIRRKPLKENIEMGIQSAGFTVLILLSIYVAYNDVLRIF